MKKTMCVGFFALVFSFIFAGFASAQNPSADWQKSKHANKHLAQEDATWEDRKEDTAHCARCHSEQGFKAWLPQLLKGDPGFLKKPDGSKADEAYIKSLGLDKGSGSTDDLRRLPHHSPGSAYTREYTHATERTSRESSWQGRSLYGMS